ncbi:MAG: hypothetical protein AAB229_04105 [Candidatus Hydrogenedentota bacterium]
MTQVRNRFTHPARQVAILLIADMQVRGRMGDSFARNGYDPVHARDEADAMELCRNQPDSFALLVCDEFWKRLMKTGRENTPPDHAQRSMDQIPFLLLADNGCQNPTNRHDRVWCGLFPATFPAEEVIYYFCRAGRN